MATYNVGNVEVAVITQASEAIAELKKLIAQAKNVSTALNGTAKSVDRVGNSAKKTSSSLSKMFTLGKLYVFLNYTRRMAQSLAKTVQNSIDYIETLNKFKVSFGELYNRAAKFQNKVSEAFGLAQIDLMNYQANFNNIIKGLGNIDLNVAYNMSETLTQMAIDFASLFNVSIDSAMTKFQSALTQQVRPIRSVSGFDITTATLQSVLSSLGITDRTVGQLSQVEKRLLIIIALQKQMATVGAMGDFARTIEQPANQLKILSQQLKETGIAIGNFALHYIAPALKYVLGFVMAIKALISTLASFLGYEMDDSVSTPLDNLEFSADDATDAIGGTKKAVEDLKKATTGIDELNIIQQPQEKDTGSGIGGGVGAIDPRLLGALQSYDTILGDVQMKATTIRDRIMEWLGFTKKINPETGEITWELNDGYTNLEKIRDALRIIGSIIAGLIGLKIAKKIAHIPIQGVAILKVVAGIALIVFGLIRTIEGINMLLDGDTTNDLKGVLTIIQGIAFMVTGVAVLFGAWPLAIAAAGVGIIAWIVSKWAEIENWADKHIADSLLDAWVAVKAFGDMCRTNFITLFANIGISIANFFIDRFNSILNLGKKTINGIIRLFNKIPGVNISFIDGVQIPNFQKKEYKSYQQAKTDALFKIAGYATGGYPSRGDYFLANENGRPEYVGSIGGRTAVANANQIIQGISYGVSMAQSEQNALLRQQNSLLQQMLAKDNGVYLDGRRVASEIDRVSNERGAKFVKGAYSYGY